MILSVKPLSAYKGTTRVLEYREFHKAHYTKAFEMAMIDVDWDTANVWKIKYKGVVAYLETPVASLILYTDNRELPMLVKTEEENYRTLVEIVL